MRFILLISILFFHKEYYSQTNLIYNGDFEIYESCPQSESSPFQNPYEITKCMGWDAPTYGTSDYFNRCATNPTISVPYNLGGFQQPYNGDGYVGGWFTNYSGGAGWDGYSGNMWWEYIQGKTTEPLKQGATYTFKLHASLAEYSDLAIREFGVYFSEEKISSQNTASLNYTPQIKFYFENYFTDTLNWVELTSYFVAKGGEKYLTIGNFKNDIQTDTLRVYDGDTIIPPQVNPFVTYIYIDAVEMYESDEIPIANIFTPNGDGINDYWIIADMPGYEIIIFNRWGNELLRKELINFAWDGTTHQGEKCSDGVYYYIIQHLQKKETIHKGFLQLIK
jgi:gliding motility-associated-like protein